MKRIYKHIFLIPACMLGVMLASCVKERFEDGYEDMDGESMVSFELQGTPLQSALTRTTGDAIREVDKIYILFYTEGSAGKEADYELAYAFTSDENCKNEVFTKGLSITSDENDYYGRTPGTEFDPNDNEWKGFAESTTQHVTTSEVQVKRGKYAVYVVANVKDFSSADFDKDKIETVGKLRNYPLEWKTNVAENNAMFGFFTEENAQQYDVINEKAPLIKISSKAVTLHAWVKRAVSKVTVAFDGSRLRDSIRIYIKSVKIHDIPKYCRLGADNKPGQPGEPKDLLYKMDEESTYKDEENTYKITYSEVNNDNKTRISKREPYFPGFSGLAEDEGSVTKWKKEVHSETSNALYFFENLQGTSNGKADADGSWKQQTDKNGNGIPDDRDKGIHPDIDTNKGILKDTKDYGTYIEVEAYYQNDNYGSRSEGSIIYRFMLGKNITDDFNAERNNHYKLTLCFKNNANDVDWHIDYSEVPGDYTPKTIYVSYEYNTPSILPVRFVGKKVTELSVTIESSNWYPDDNSIKYYKDGNKPVTTQPSDAATGFLSLRYDANPRIGEHNDAVEPSEVSSYWNVPSTNKTRQYVKGGAEVKDEDDYKVQKEFGYGVIERMNSEGKTVSEVNIPLFTRPLIIYKWTSWTGANPYYTSSRSAKIKLSGTVCDDLTKQDETYSETITVIQVPRIENPSGIYRSYDNDDEFDVTCMARTGEMYDDSAAISFAEFNSVGAWRAIIYRSSDGAGESKDWFTLTAGSQKADAVGEYIQGDPNSPIKFSYKPNGKIINPNEVRCGVIKVEYNNYACTHYIFVRQGYAPMQLEEGNVYWHTFNLYSANAETSYPCDAGSLFVRGCLSPAILDTNPQTFGQAVPQFDVINDGAYITMTLTDINNLNKGDFPSGYQSLTTSSLNPWKSGRVPTVEDWATLKSKNSDTTIDKGFGVLYADGVNSTQTNPTNVWGCLHANVNTNDGQAARGMRGCFVYNESDGRNIFLPIGASGFGRRKMKPIKNGSANGELQYGFGDTFNKDLIKNTQRPLLYNLNSNEGAIYWTQKLVNANAIDDYSKNVNSWDINYKTFDFDYMDAGENENAACYIRLVQDNDPKTEAPE